MTTNYVAWLHLLIQDRCRTNGVAVEYIDAGIGRVMAVVGARQFVGDRIDGDWRAAKESAAKRAYEELVFLSEGQIGGACGLPARPCISEADEMRDVLQRIRKRANEELQGGARHSARAKVGHAYQAVDRLEEQLLKPRFVERTYIVGFNVQAVNKFASVDLIPPDCLVVLSRYSKLRQQHHIVQCPPDLQANLAFLHPNRFVCRGHLKLICPTSCTTVLKILAVQYTQLVFRHFAVHICTSCFALLERLQKHPDPRQTLRQNDELNLRAGLAVLQVIIALSSIANH